MYVRLEQWEHLTKRTRGELVAVRLVMPHAHCSQMRHSQQYPKKKNEPPEQQDVRPRVACEVSKALAVCAVWHACYSSFHAARLWEYRNIGLPSFTTAPRPILFHCAHRVRAQCLVSTKERQFFFRIQIFPCIIVTIPCSESLYFSQTRSRTRTPFCPFTWCTGGIVRHHSKNHSHTKDPENG